MSNGQTPETLPADFFKKRAAAAPETLPADFFKKQPPTVAELKEAAPELARGATMSPRKPGILTWLQNLEADIRTGTDVTAPGRLLKGMGAKGTGFSPAEEFISSPALGAVHAAQGLATIPQAPWQGTKQTVGGAMEALTIPGLIEAAPSEAGATALGLQWGRAQMSAEIAAGASL